MLLLGVVAVVLAIALAVAWWSALDARERLDVVLAEQGQIQGQMQAESSRLATELEASQSAGAALEAELAEANAALDELEVALSGGEAELGTLSGEVVSLRQDLSALQSDLDEAVTVIEERDTTVAQQEVAIAVLSECLEGMQVALAFARSGQLGSADRAYMAISETCDRARELL